jgi:hypothetical protein
LSSEPGETRVLIPFIAAGDTKTISVALGARKLAAPQPATHPPPRVALH